MSHIGGGNYMSRKREMEALIVLAGKVDPSLKKALRDAGKSTKGLNNTTQLFGKVATKAFTAMKVAAAAGAVAVGAGMVYIAKKGLALASDLTEVQNVVDVTFGKNAELINKWAQEAKKGFGLSELAAKQYAGTMGALLKSAGVADDNISLMSTTLSALSADFASFYNLDTDEAFDKIKSGISGQTEPLKSLGINMSVATLEAYALSQGIKTAFSSMSTADQAILRYNYLLSVSKDAQTDFSRNIETFANQQRIWSTNIQELSAKIMRGAIPAFEKLMQKGNQLMESFMDDLEKMQQLQDTVAKVFDKVIDAIPTAISYAQSFTKGIWDIFTAGYKVFTFIHRNWSTIAPMILGIVGALTLWKTATIAMKAYEGVMIAIKAATAIATAVQWALNTAVLANPLTGVIVLISAAIAVLVAGFYALYKNWDTVQGFLVNTWTNVKNAFAKGINWVIDKLNWLIEKINLIPGIEIPLIPKIGESVRAAAVQTHNTPTFEQFAKGGIATRASIFGEAGPEMAIPLKRTPLSLGLLNQTAKILGVGGSDGSGTNFIFAPQISGGNAAEMERTLRPLAEDMFDLFEQWLEAKRREEFA